MSETAEVIGTEEPVAEETAAEETAAEEAVEEDTAEETADEVTEEVTEEETAADEDDEEDAPAESVRSAESDDDLLVQEGDIAGDYLERLLDILDFDGDIDLDVEAGRAMVSVDGGEDLEKLVGPRGNVLEALQELTRLAVQQETGGRSRLMLDVAGWREGRREELRELARSAAQSVVDSGEPGRLQPMSPFERKIVHDVVAGIDGLTSESEGEEPKRRVVIIPTE